jgi:pyruvate-formate lyase
MRYVVIETTDGSVRGVLIGKVVRVADANRVSLHDCASLRMMASGIAGMSVYADSLSAIKDIRVRVTRDEASVYSCKSLQP